MKTIEQVLSYVRSLDVQVWVEGERLKYNAPRGAIGPELLAELKNRKTEIVDFLTRAGKASRSMTSPLRPVSHDQALPLSYAQERQWFFYQMDPDNTAYNMPAHAHLRGELNVDALQHGIQELVRRHEILRTRFLIGENGEAVQMIEPVFAAPISFSDLRSLEKEAQDAEIACLAEEEARRPFDLSQCPLFRIRLLQTDEREYVALVIMHHIISDEWSAAVFLRELALFYESFVSARPVPLPELHIQYADFAHWQRQVLEGELLERQLAYWRQKLAGLPPMLELPTDFPRPPQQSYRGAEQVFTFSKSLSERLGVFSRQEQATPFMTLLTALNVLCYRYTAQEDIAIGVPVANRNRPELEPLIGFFVNTLVVRTDLSNTPSFRELLRQVRDTASEAQDYQDLPFERIVAELQPKRELSYHPVFQVMFVWQAPSTQPVDLPGLTFTPFAIDETTALFDLVLLMNDGPEGLAGKCIYNRDLFEASTILRFTAHLECLLQAIILEPDREIATFPIMSAAEQQELLRDWNETQCAYPEQSCIHHLFEKHVEQTPEAIALRFGGQELSYQHLNQRANQVAHYLQEQLELPLETLVGICVERSPEMIIGILGILKAGCAYLPLDPAYPKARLSFMLSDSCVPVILTQGHLSGTLPEHAAQVVCLDSDWEQMRQSRTGNPTMSLSAGHLAYVIYTSGSTGKPKGTLLSHRGLCNVSQAQINMFQLSPKDEVLQFASLSFDAASFELVMALCSGATLCLGTREELLPGPALLKFLRDREISVVTLPPSALANLPHEELPALRIITVAGETCSADLVNRWAGGRLFFNLYGPTESTIWATAARCVPGEKNPSIGRPIANTRIYILDASLQPVPVGVPGELHIGGVGLARGYLNRPDLTTEKFIQNPFGEHPEERLYKTGDLARYVADGSIEFLGRLDHQIKLRGFRIELGEIEQSLSQHDDVRECAVLLREDSPGDKRLVAYLVLTEECAAGVEDVRNFLKKSLPEYMVPAFLVILEKLPLTPNGKIDRHALPAPDPSFQQSQKKFIAPRIETEKRLALLWSELLNVERIGIHDDFFELGGHSLLAAQLIAKISTGFERDIPVQQLFLHPNIAQLARLLEQHAEPLSERKDFLGTPEPGWDRLAEDVQKVESSFLQFERRSLLPLFLTEKIEPVDAAALSYLDPLTRYLPSFDREEMVYSWCQDLPVLSQVFETQWGRIAHLFLPRFAADLYSDRDDTVGVALDALRIAKAIGAKVVSLTGIIPSATDYGRTLVKALEKRPDLPRITTGHATTCATVVLTIKKVLAAGGRDLELERVGFLGLGSVGMSVLALMLRSLPHPKQLFLCDVYAKQHMLEKTRQELHHGAGDFGGEIKIFASHKEIPDEFYEADLIVGATNVPDVLDVDKLKPGAMIVDDSGPHCFRSEQAIARLEKQGDILFSEGGVLQLPHPIKEVQYLPPFLEPMFNSEQLARHWQDDRTRITSCILSSLLSAGFKELSPTVGMVENADALKHYEKLIELGCQAADLRCEAYDLPEALLTRFREQFSRR